MKNYLISSYRKAIKVIQSSLNQDHIEASRNYINNFFVNYSTNSKSKYSFLKVREVDNMVAQMYGRLYNMLEKKEKDLK
mgnify:FL=1|tara:strand:+ start:3207 stop:3443 length:237 start_codon:yes stop_codon:yes gene_type:complete